MKKRTQKILYNTGFTIGWLIIGTTALAALAIVSSIIARVWDFFYNLL